MRARGGKSSENVNKHFGVLREKLKREKKTDEKPIGESNNFYGPGKNRKSEGFTLTLNQGEKKYILSKRKKREKRKCLVLKRKFDERGRERK